MDNMGGIGPRNYLELKRGHENYEKNYDLFYDRALELIERGEEIWAHTLLQLSWNKAHWARHSFDKNTYENLSKALNHEFFEKLKTKELDTIDLKDGKDKDMITILFGLFQKMLSHTGASKSLHLKNTKLFVPWDTKIRYVYKISQKPTPEDYYNFLKQMQSKIKKILKTHSKESIEKELGRPLAKLIDEYNWFYCNRSS